MTDPQLSPLGGGWIRARRQDRPYVVLARTEVRDGRRMVVDVVVCAEDGHRVDAQALRTVPISWIESIINMPGLPEEIARHDDHGDMASLDKMIRSAVTVGATCCERSTPAASVNRTPLSRPDGLDPDAFYRRVAEAYVDVLTRTTAIAPALAEEAGVPVATVHRWIGEARRRGFLNPARKGRAG